MTPMLQRIRERAATKSKKPKGEFVTTHMLGEYAGERQENARLLPLIDALIQAVEKANRALHCNEEICEISGGCYNCNARASMQSILEKAVGK